MDLHAGQGRRTLAVVVAVLALGPLVGCGHRQATPAPSDSPSVPTPGTAAAAPPPLRVSFRHVSGHLPVVQRQRLARQVQRVVVGWWSAAYLNDRATKTFPAFTPAAARLAERRAGVTTSSLPPGTSLAVVRREMAIDVLAVRSRPVGVDVVTDLVYAAGTRPTKYQVRGTLSLTPTREGWRVFAFDVTKRRLGGRSPGATSTRHPTPSPGGAS